MRALELAMSTPWAMLPEAIEQVLSIAARENDPTPEALEAYRQARADRGERLGMRDNVAVLNVVGPMFKRANLMTAYSGATSYEMLRRDFQVALDDPKADAILLNIDSPGGEVSGCDELATAIYQARGRKPIWAYVSGMAASAAYWLAASTDRIVVSDASAVGSIGVVIGITDRKKAEERAGISRIEFVSSQSPDKRPDHETDEGRAKIQKIVDDLGDVFVKTVAKYRGMQVATVLSDFGQGGVEIGANAVKKRMVDEVGQFEATLKSLSARGRSGKPARTAAASGAALKSALITSPQGIAVATVVSNGPGAITGHANPDEIAAIRARFKAFSAIEATEDLTALHAHLRDNTDATAEEAVRILDAARADIEPIIMKNAAGAYAARRAAAGSLGMEHHPNYKAPAGESMMTMAGSWSSAVANANRAAR